MLELPFNIALSTKYKIARFLDSEQKNKYLAHESADIKVKQAFQYYFNASKEEKQKYALLLDRTRFECCQRWHVHNQQRKLLSLVL